MLPTMVTLGNSHESFPAIDPEGYRFQNVRSDQHTLKPRNRLLMTFADAPLTATSVFRTFLPKAKQPWLSPMVMKTLCRT